MNNSLVDKEKLLANENAEKNAIKFEAQIEINRIKQQRDLELLKATENAKNIESKFNNANEELENLKIKYAKLEEELS